jgi:outer membrane protein assembly factor BamA
MKNRRLISFLSLFSLVLVLSIYYVLVPVNTATINTDNPTEDSAQVSVTDGEDAYFENLELAKVSKFNDDIEELNQVVASSSSTMNEKIEALEMIAQKKKLNKEEAELKKSIKEAGYTNAYVEYENNIVNILVSKKEATKTDAVTIIKLAYEKLGNSYIPSVSFKA